MDLINNLEVLVNNKIKSLNPINDLNFQLIKEYKNRILDIGYFHFITNLSNGGFFYNKAIQFYSFINENNFQNINSVNIVILNQYGSLAEKLIFFGQDLFGNQFAFDEVNKSILFFNIESAEKKLIAKNFQFFLDVLLEDIDYYSAMNILNLWPHELQLDERLTPKIPFIIGGEYEINNLYAARFPTYIEFFADFAKQIKDLPDGTNIDIKVIK